jgi:IclR family transcriptional regulator, mhp operon transcriptional activator
MDRDRKQEPPTAARGVERTLAVLRALNSQNGARVSDLAKKTGISRPALYRILEALSSLGYIRRREAEERYELTILVRTLSDGFNDETWVRAVAQPVMEALQRDIVWPTDIATFFDGSMFLRETTRRHSPLTVDSATAGLRLPMLLSATGRTYLAFCADEERKTILENLRRSNAPEDERARNVSYVNNLIETTRRNGYGERHREIYDKTGAIAVPIRRAGHVLACLNISFIASALTPSEAADRYLSPLRAAATSIEQRLASSSG